MNEEHSRAIDEMRNWFESGATLSYTSRITWLKKLKVVIREWEGRLLDAMMEDLGKSRFEAYETEVGVVQAELSHTVKHLRKWMKAGRVPTPLAHFPSRSRILKQPKGVVLVMSPWNYPVQLSLVPVAAAISAGCCVVLKPSRYSPAVSRVLKEMLETSFDSRLVRVFEGGHQVNSDLLEQHWDHIFFTGSPAVGRVVMEAASKHLTPVTLELGGKSPVIVDGTAGLAITARRLAWGKFLNAGQTCVAPDYLLIDEKVKDDFIKAFEAETRKLYPDMIRSKDLGKIINEKHFKRLQGLLEGQQVAFGGDVDEEVLKISPTLLVDVDPSSPVMQEEIFGPILPMLTYKDFDEALSFIRKRPRPLALYIFSRDKSHIKAVEDGLVYGGGCVNDTVIQLSNPSLPFGGIGESGMGAYHAKMGFDTFTHHKSVLRKGLWLDIPVRYAPYDEGLKLKLVKTLLR